MSTLDKKSYVFVGNRFGVLDLMLRRGLSVSRVLAVPGSFLERELRSRTIPFTPIENRLGLVDELRSLAFDVLVSNGCPHILPVSDLRRPQQVFVNVHGSLLPDLAGRHPVNGAVLFERELGATCHLMDDGVDSGPVIAQVRIGKPEGLELALLYHMTFDAEVLAFGMALDGSFLPANDPPGCDDPIYYTRSHEDMQVDLDDDPASTIRRICAFGIQSQGVACASRIGLLRFCHAVELFHPYLDRRKHDFSHRQVMYAYGDRLVIRLHDAVTCLEVLSGEPRIVPGEEL